MTSGVLPPSGMGGDDGEDKATEPDTTVTDVTEADNSLATEGRDRRELASSVELNPGSLVGSFFHRIENGEMVWGGIVVGEPQAGMYLCQVDSGLYGAEQARVQVVMSLPEMTAKDEGYEFRFYDTEDAMREAFAEYTISAERG